mgnify:CR=1 FL=1
MRLRKFVKGVAIALPLLALAACSSNDAEQTSTASTNTNTETASTSTSSGVQTGTASRIKSPEEIRQEKMDRLRREHIVYFDFDKSRIDSSFSEVLDAHAEFLRDNSNVSVLVEGHADERGTPEYNIALGERRALAVSRYLINSGVSESQVTVVSYGEEKPAVKSRTEAAHAKNRRAVLVY